MRDINRSEIMGRLAEPPVVRTSANGASRALLKVITNRWARADRDSGGHEVATSHRVVVFDNAQKTLIPSLMQNCGTGSTVFIVGRHESRSYEDQSGRTCWITELVTSDIKWFTSSERPSSEPPVASDVANAFAA